MTIALSDFVSNAATAARPQRMVAARRRVASAPDTNEFGNLISTNSRALRSPSNKTSPANQKTSTQSSAEDPTGAAYRGLGAVLLQKTLEAMIPDQGGIVASRGAASSAWKSMLAQQLAESISAAVFQEPRTLGAPALAARRPPKEYGHG